MTRMIRLTAVYAIFTAIAVFIVIFFINASIVVDNPLSDETGISKPETSIAAGAAKADTHTYASGKIQNPGVLQSLAGIPAGAGFLSFSGDGQYCVYCYGGSLFIMDIRSGKITKQITEMNPITYAVLMYDRNIVIYFTNGSKITVNTYNIDTGTTTIQSALKAGNGAVIKQADYSSMTGHVSFDVYNGKSDVIYYLDLMKKLAKISVGGQVENMALTNGRQTIYYEKGNTLYYQARSVKSLRNVRTRLLGCDLRDYVYVQLQSDKSRVYVVKGAGVVKKIQLSDTGFTKVYSNKTDIYLVYPGYILDLSTDPAEKIAYSGEYGFEGYIGGRMYLSDKSGNIIVKETGSQG